MKTREHPIIINTSYQSYLLALGTTQITPGIYRSANDSVMKSERSSLVRGSDLPNSAHTSVGDVWRRPARRLIKKHFAALDRHTGRTEWITYSLQ